MEAFSMFLFDIWETDKTYPQHNADPLYALLERPVLGLPNRVNDALVVDGYLEAFGVHGFDLTLCRTISIIFKTTWQTFHSRECPKHMPRWPSPGSTLLHLASSACGRRCLEYPWQQTCL